MADPEITTLIVDDHEVVREGLRLSLSRAPHIRVIGEAADGACGCRRGCADDEAGGSGSQNPGNVTGRPTSR